MEVGHEISDLSRILNNFVDALNIRGKVVRVHQDILHHTRIDDAPGHKTQEARHIEQKRQEWLTPFKFRESSENKIAIFSRI